MTSKAITKAAESAAKSLSQIGQPSESLVHRFNAAERLAGKPNGKQPQVSATLVNGVLHTVVSDGKTTLEIYDGAAQVRLEKDATV